MSWLDDTDDDEPEFDEADIRVRPNPKANRPRTKRRPAHIDARIARVLGVDRGRYVVLVAEDTPEEHESIAMRARELRKRPIVTGDLARDVGDTTGADGTLGRIVGIEPRTSLLRRSADDTDQVERIVVRTRIRCSSSWRRLIRSRGPGWWTGTSSRHWMPASALSSS